MVRPDVLCNRTNFHFISTLHLASSDESGIARASINIGVAQLALKKFDEALECQLKALKIAEKLDDSEMKGNAMGNLGW